jgi:hypothetical protein
MRMPARRTCTLRSSSWGRKSCGGRGKADDPYRWPGSLREPCEIAPSRFVCGCHRAVVASSSNATCRIRRYECSLCCARPVLKPARPLPKSSDPAAAPFSRERSHVCSGIPTFRAFRSKSMAPPETRDVEEQINMKGYRLLSHRRPPPPSNQLRIHLCLASCCSSFCYFRALRWC